MGKKYGRAVLFPLILCVLLFPGCKELFHPNSDDDEDDGKNSGDTGLSGTSGLSAPTGLDVSISGNSLYVYWDAVDGAEWYECFIAESPNGNYMSLPGRMYGTFASIDIEDIEWEMYSDIYIKMRACKNGVQSPLSAYCHLTTQNGQGEIPLVYNQWKSNTLSPGITHSYTFPVYAGRTYYITWDDSDDGTYSYSADIKVSARINGDVAFSGVDRGYDQPKPVTAGVSGNMLITVEGYYSNESGTYAIKYYYD
jgi:hypothetical protein